MKYLLLIFSLATCLAQAETYDYTCTLVNDFDDWTVRVGTLQADFFDNNTNCILTKPIGGNPALYLSTEDCDSNVRFLFNAEKLTGELQFPDGLKLGRRKVKKLAMTCVEGAYQDLTRHNSKY